MPISVPIKFWTRVSTSIWNPVFNPILFPNKETDSRWRVISFGGRDDLKCFDVNTVERDKNTLKQPENQVVKSFWQF